MTRRKNYKINQILGQNIKAARVLRKLSQDKFAEMLHIEPATLSNIERGISYPAVQTLEKIIEVLDINPYLLYISDDDIDINETRVQIIKLLEKLKQNKKLYKRAYDFILELSHGI